MKKVFVLVCMFGDLIQEVYVFEDQKKAETEFKKYTDFDYPKLMNDENKLTEKKWEDLFDRFNSTKYAGSRIYECEVKK